MQGHPEVIAYLTQQLRGELAARDQYFLHSRRYQDLGLTRLHARSDHEMQEETQHADALLQRLLMLEAEPDMRPDAFDGGTDVPGMLRADLELEYEVRASLRAGIAICEAHQDYVTRDLLLVQLQDTESDHAYWLEKQLGLIDKIGLENYLQSQL
jgi:bacterioferritin